MKQPIIQAEQDNQITVELLCDNKHISVIYKKGTLQ